MRPLLLIGLLGALGAVAPAQATRAPRPGVRTLDCRACHTAVKPTKQDPALRSCPRLLIKGYHVLDEAPVALTLGQTAGRYPQVRFPHRAHAHMAETASGCSGCHHYDQAGPIQPCRTCHAVTRARDDLSKPDLQAAMHRQCLDCHRDWNAASACAACHRPVGAPADTDAARRTARASSPVAPTRIVYQTGAREGDLVTFFHAEHTGRFALACAACHQEQTCRTCHTARPAATADPSSLTRRAALGRTAAQAHARCSACHAVTGCTTCHAARAATAARFDHARRTGWALNRFHAPLDCRQCHTAPGKLTAPSTDCESCHKGWQTRFDHRKAGLVLDDVHAGVECAGCHEDATFRARPVCGGCHTDKAWPAQKPGRPVGRAAPKG